MNLNIIYIVYIIFFITYKLESAPVDKLIKISRWSDGNKYNDFILSIEEITDFKNYDWKIGSISIKIKIYN